MLETVRVHTNAAKNLQSGAPDLNAAELGAMGTDSTLKHFAEKLWQRTEREKGICPGRFSIRHP
jgi:hypothetical protein